MKKKERRRRKRERERERETEEELLGIMTKFITGGAVVVAGELSAAEQVLQLQSKCMRLQSNDMCSSI